MILRMYAFFDSKASYFSAPFFLSHDGLAMRAASDLVNDRSTSLSRHPADFTLMYLGEFDDQTAQMLAVPPQPLAVCTAFVPATEGKLI